MLERAYAIVRDTALDTDGTLGLSVVNCPCAGSKELHVVLDRADEYEHDEEPLESCDTDAGGGALRNLAITAILHGRVVEHAVW